MSQIEKDVRRYIDLRHQLAELEAEINSLKRSVFGHVREAGGELQFGNLVFRCALTRSWSYSDAVTELRARLKEKKREEIQLGIAQLKKETHFVTMRPLDQERENRSRSRARGESDPPRGRWTSTRG